jgi:hypothetical protein
MTHFTDAKIEAREEPGLFAVTYIESARAKVLPGLSSFSSYPHTGPTRGKGHTH